MRPSKDNTDCRREKDFRIMVVIMGHYGARHAEAVKSGVTEFTEQHAYPRVLAIADYEPASWIDFKGATMAAGTKAR
jgi:hypothetical protein